VPAAPRERRRWPWIVGLATVAVVGVGAGVAGTVLLAGDDGDESYCAALDTHARRDVPMLAFLRPEVSADEDAIARIEEIVRDLPDVTDVELTGQDEAYAEAQELFAQDPTTLDMLRLEDVPASFRFTVPDSMASVDAERALRADDGVFEVERPDFVMGRTVLEVLGPLDDDDLLGEHGRFGHWIDPDLAEELEATAPGAVEDDIAVIVDDLADDEGTIDVGTQRAADVVIADARTRCADR
jgi:hypothetical protein